MDCYPAELKETPIPLAALLGTTDAHSSLLAYLHAINSECPTPIRFISLPLEHRFPEKKELKEKAVSSFPLRAERNYEGVRPQGILKAGWMRKHHELLPAVSVPFFDFDPRLPSSDWVIYETIIADEVNRLRRTLAGRDCRIILLLLQTNEKEDQGVVEERLFSLRKRTELDSKSVLMLKTSDIVPGSPVIRKFESAIRTHALEYYRIQAKRVKRYKKAAVKANQLILQVRHSFKIAHYYEFRRQTAKMLKHYYGAYRSIITIPMIDSDEENRILYGQVKKVADFINFKICYHEFFSSSGIKTAKEQFQLHVRTFAKAIGPPERAYEHWEWVSLQYKIFAQLLQEKKRISAGVNLASGLDSDVYAEPYIYYLTAAKFATKRRKAAESLGLSHVYDESNLSLHVKTNDFIVQPAEFIGADPIVTELAGNHSGSLPQPSDLAAKKYRERQEKNAPQADIVVQLLKLALGDSFDDIADGTSPLHSHRRMKFRVTAQLGIEHLAARRFEEARHHLVRAKDAYGMERWSSIVSQLLKYLLICSYYQRDVMAYIDYTLQLLSPKLTQYVTIQERLDAQQKLMQAWYNPETIGPHFLNSVQQNTQDIALDRSRPLFHCGVQFSCSTAYVKDEVTIDFVVESFFPAAITFSRMDICFSDESYNIFILHKENASHLEVGNTNFRNLTFEPEQIESFSMGITIHNGRNIVQCHEIRLHIPEKPDGAEFIFTVRVSGSNSVCRRNSLVKGEGLIPGMGQGMGSPSFSRSLPHQGFHQGNSQANISMDFELNDDTGAFGTYVIVLQPSAKATVELLEMPTLLVGDYRVLRMKISSNADTMRDVSCKLLWDLTGESKPRLQPLFWKWDNGFDPMPSGPDFQMQESLPFPDLSAQSCHVYEFYVKGMLPVTHTITVLLAYTTGRDVEVIVDKHFKLECKVPLVATFDFFSECRQLENPRESPGMVTKLFVNEPAFVIATMTGLVNEKLDILVVDFEKAQPEKSTLLASSGCFTSTNQQPVIVSLNDQHGVCLQFMPVEASKGVSLGKIRVRWRRRCNGDYSDDRIVTTFLDLPKVIMEKSQFSIRLETPPNGILGKPLTMNLLLTNNTATLQAIKISVASSSDFLLAGLTKFTENAQPGQTLHSQFTLVPMTTGHLRLPTFDVISSRTQSCLLSADDPRELYVLPATSAVSIS